MARRMNEDSIDAKVKVAQQKVLKLKAAYDAAVAELDELRKLQRQLRADRLLDAMDKKGKSFDEVLRLINL